MKLFMTMTVTGILMVMELASGNIGLQLAVPLYAAVYFAVAYGMLYGIIAAGSVGFLLDILYARTLPVLPFMMTLIMMIPVNYLRHSQRKLPGSPLSAGMITGFLNCIGSWLYIYFSNAEYSGPNSLCLTVFQITAGGLFMLLLTVLLDALNYRCDLPQFCPRGFSRHQREDDL